VTAAAADTSRDACLASHSRAAKSGVIGKTKRGWLSLSRRRPAISTGETSQLSLPNTWLCLAVARTSSLSPSLSVLDEPVSALDALMADVRCDFEGNSI